LKVVLGREKCLDVVKETVEHLKNFVIGSDEMRDCVEQLSETVKDLRILSLEVVEQVLRWRESLMAFHFQKQGLDSGV